MPLSLSNLTKLTIKAYDTPKRSDPAVAAFEAQFNPSTLSQQFGVEYHGKQYIRRQPAELRLTLILDGTGTADSDRSMLAKSPSVTERVKTLLDMAYRIEEGIHQPRYLKVVWGDLDFTGGLQREVGSGFPCRLQQANVSYTSFDRNGTPLRAEVAITLMDDYPPPLLSSPDLTHTRVVLAGDTLPALSLAIYGSAEHYLFIARKNDLDNFRRLVPGQVLKFPPLETSAADSPPARRGSTG